MANNLENKLQRLKIVDFPEENSYVPYPECRRDNIRGEYLFSKMNRILKNAKRETERDTQDIEMKRKQQKRFCELEIRRAQKDIKKAKKALFYSRHMGKWFKEVITPDTRLTPDNDRVQRHQKETLNISIEPRRTQDNINKEEDGALTNNDEKIPRKEDTNAELVKQDKGSDTFMEEGTVDILNTEFNNSISTTQDAIQASSSNDANALNKDTDNTHIEYEIKFQNDNNRRKKVKRRTFLSRNYNPNSDRLFNRYLKEKRAVEKEMHSRFHSSVYTR